MPEETVPIEYFIRYLKAVREYWAELNEIKTTIANMDGEDDDFSIQLAKAAFADIPHSEQQTIWRATTRGSVFTTNERRVLKL